MDMSSICRENRKKRKRILIERKNKSQKYHNQIRNNEIIPPATSVHGVEASICKENRRKRKIILSRSRKKKEAIVHANSSHPRVQDSLLPQITDVVSSSVQTQHIEQSYLGLPEYQCQSCGALLWYNERIYKNQNESTPRFSVPPRVRKKPV